MAIPVLLISTISVAKLSLASFRSVSARSRAGCAIVRPRARPISRMATAAALPVPDVPVHLLFDRILLMYSRDFTWSSASNLQVTFLPSDGTLGPTVPLAISRT